MTLSMDRRSVLTGLGALGVSACGPADDGQGTPAVLTIPEHKDLDLSALEARHGGRLGFAMLDPDYRLWGWRSDERFVYCSTFKAFLAAATLARVQAGDERLDRAVAVTSADMVPHAPVTQAAVGSTLTIEALAKATVELSDNPAANILLREMGGLEVFQNFYRRIDDDVTRVDRWEPEMNRLDGEKDTTTPRQAATNLHALFFNEESRATASRPVGPLNDGSRQRLLRWMMDTPTGPDRLKAGVPDGWRVAHKTGTGGYGPTNDIGILYPPSGAPIIIAAYYHATPETSDAQNAAVIAEATRLALTALGRTA